MYINVLIGGLGDKRTKKKAYRSSQILQTNIQGVKTFFQYYNKISNFFLENSPLQPNNSYPNAFTFPPLRPTPNK